MLLAATAALYLWNLSASGWANAFYSAAAQAGGQSWQAFFFGGLDPVGGITVDKPPAALWLTSLSVRLFGLSTPALLLPQALCAVATVGLLYATVRRQALTQAKPIDYRIYYADFRDVDGMKWPFRLRRAIAGETIEETTFDRIRINAKIDPKKFEVRK